MICGEKFKTSSTAENVICVNCLCANGRKGYICLKRDLDYSFFCYTKDEMNAICEKRDKLISESRDSEGLTIEELKDAGKCGRYYQKDECKKFVKKLKENLIPNDPGGFYTKKFVVPSAYAGIAVDLKDVFAIVIDTPNYKNKPKHKDIVSIGFFTNDPEAPMFAIGKSFRKKLFVFNNIRKRKSLAKELTALCPNLTYPIMTYTQFTKTIKKDGSVKGNISADNLYFQIKNNGRNADYPFHMAEPLISINGFSFLNKFGYVYSDQVGEYLFSTRRSQKFWCKKLGWSTFDMQRMVSTSANIGGIFFRLVRLFMSFS